MIYNLIYQYQYCQYTVNLSDIAYIKTFNSADLPNHKSVADTDTNSVI